MSTLYSASIGLPAMLVSRWLPARVRGRSEIAQWLIYAGVLCAITAVGTLVAGLLLVAVRATSLEDVGQSYLRGLQIGLAIAVPVTIGAVTFARLRARLVHTEASLHADGAWSTTSRAGAATMIRCSTTSSAR